MKIFVTGASGFVGQAIVDAALQHGHSVTALVRDSIRAQKLLGTKVQLIVSSDKNALRDALRNSDAIINLAGAPIAGARWTAGRKKELAESRVGTTTEIVTALAGLTQRPKVFLSASAVGIYGNAGDQNCDETSSQGSDFLSQLCSRWEDAALAAEKLGMRVALLRFGVVLGTNGGALTRMLPPFRLGMGGPIGDGKQYMSWIHRTDLVNIVLRALEDERFSHEINCTAPQPVTNSEFTQTLGSVLRRPTPLRVPPAILRLAFGDGASILLDSQRVLPKKLMSLGFEFRFPNLRAALNDILGSHG